MFSVSKFTFSPWPGNPNASPGEVGIILNKSILFDPEFRHHH
jgi:hypothetical protein